MKIKIYGLCTGMNPNYAIVTRIPPPKLSLGAKEEQIRTNHLSRVCLWANLHSYIIVTVGMHNTMYADLLFSQGASLLLYLHSYMLHVRKGTTLPDEKRIH